MNKDVEENCPALKENYEKRGEARAATYPLERVCSKNPGLIKESGRKTFTSKATGSTLRKGMNGFLLPEWAKNERVT